MKSLGKHNQSEMEKDSKSFLQFKSKTRKIKSSNQIYVPTKRQIQQFQIKKIMSHKEINSLTQKNLRNEVVDLLQIEKNKYQVKTFEPQNNNKKKEILDSKNCEILNLEYPYLNKLKIKTKTLENIMKDNQNLKKQIEKEKQSRQNDLKNKKSISKNINKIDKEKLIRESTLPLKIQTNHEIKMLREKKINFTPSKIEHSELKKIKLNEFLMKEKNLMKPVESSIETFEIRKRIESSSMDDSDILLFDSKKDSFFRDSLFENKEIPDNVKKTLLGMNFEVESEQSKF